MVSLVLGACSFQVSPTGATADGGPLDGPPPDLPPVACGDLTCDPHAVCLEMPARCACADGYTGDGMTCVDVDECTAGTSGCPAACENTGGGFACYAPRTCAELAQHVPGFTGGDVTLYAGGDAAKPWPAFCSASQLEYLAVPAASNYAQYTRDPGADVRTSYARIRIDPGTLAVDIDDKTYAQSMGALTHGGETVTSMPYGVAMDCEGNNSQTGVASIDLSGTPFVVSDSFEVGGASARGSVDVNGRMWSLTGGGNCGWQAPAPAPYNPFNSIGPAPILELAYQP